MENSSCNKLKYSNVPQSPCGDLRAGQPRLDGVRHDNNGVVVDGRVAYETPRLEIWIVVFPPSAIFQIVVVVLYK